MTNKFRCLRSISIDRIDNQLGHTKGNIQLVCKWVNLGRLEHTITEFWNILRSCIHNQKQLLTEPTSMRIRDFMRKLLWNIRSRCSSKVNKAKKNARHHNLTLDFLCELYQQQNGLCAITKLPLKLERGSLKSCSIDRIENSLEYHRTNIQLVCKWVNTARSEHTIEEFKEILNKLRTLKRSHS